METMCNVMVLYRRGLCAWEDVEDCACEVMWENGMKWQEQEDRLAEWRNR